MRAEALLPHGLMRAHRIVPQLAGHVWTSIFINTRGLGTYPDDLCPLGATRVELVAVPRVSSAFVWGSDEPTVLALHGWGTDSTAMSTVVAAVLERGESAVCFDAPGHGVSPGSRATMGEYAHATRAVLQRFPSIHTVVAHSFAAIAAVSALAESDDGKVRNLLLLAPVCSLSGVLDRWAAQRGMPPALVKRIDRDLARRDGMPVSHWDIRTLGLPSSVRVRILHDPTDDVVPSHDSDLIATRVSADVDEAVAGTGHHKIIGGDDMRKALDACLQRTAGRPEPASS
jgi:pimeloyl-ACP methyl ester carboxylesterase